MFVKTFCRTIEIIFASKVTQVRGNYTGVAHRALGTLNVGDQEVAFMGNATKFQREVEPIVSDVEAMVLFGRKVNLHKGLVT